ncbi:MAG: hypothetical protein ACREET_01900 [Stellaceae bacterium]
MTAITVAVMVILPAKLDSAAVEARALAAARPASAPAIAGPLRVDVVAGRDAAWTPTQARVDARKRKSQGSGRVGARAIAAPERVGYRGPGADPEACAI